MPRLLPHQVWVETDRPAFPMRCVKCGRPSETVYRPTPPQRPKGLPLPDSPLELPYCQLCLKNLNESHLKATRNLVALNVGLWGAALVLGLKLSPVFVAIPIFFALAIYLWATVLGKRVTKSAKETEISEVAVKSLWHKKSTYIFSFSNESVSEEFKTLNQIHLTPHAETKNY